MSRENVSNCLDCIYYNETKKSFVIIGSFRKLIAHHCIPVKFEGSFHCHLFAFASGPVSSTRSEAQIECTHYYSKIRGKWPRNGCKTSPKLESGQQRNPQVRQPCTALTPLGRTFTPAICDQKNRNRSQIPFDCEIQVRASAKLQNDLYTSN